MAATQIRHVLLALTDNYSWGFSSQIDFDEPVVFVVGVVAAGAGAADDTVIVRLTVLPPFAGKIKSFLV